jgi:hypothetical protein
MKSAQSSLVAALTLILVGCSSTPTQVDTGVIHARTFSFVQPGPKPWPVFADKDQAIHDAIQKAITRTLGAKGLAPVARGGDVTVGYLLIVGNNAGTMAIDDYFGHSGDVAGLQDKAHNAYTSSKNPNYFEAGTLVIDIADSRSFKLLKRGFVTRPVLRDASAETRATRVQEAVDAIVRDLRFVP